MLDKDLLDILVCPESREPVEPADAGLLERVNREIETGRIRTRGGEVVRTPIPAGLIRRDGKLLYPVLDDIPIMLIDEALVLED